MAQFKIQEAFKEELERLKSIVFNSDIIVQSKPWQTLKQREDVIGGALFDLSDEAPIDSYCSIFNKLRHYLNDCEIEVAQLLNTQEFEEKLSNTVNLNIDISIESELVKELDRIGSMNSAQLIAELTSVCNCIESGGELNLNETDHKILSTIADIPLSLKLDDELFEAHQVALETLSLDIDFTSDEIGLLDSLKVFHDSGEL